MPRNRSKGGLSAQAPYSAAAQADALYASLGQQQNACLSSCVQAAGSVYARSVMSPGALQPVGSAAAPNYGGLNPSMGFGPYYQPGTATLRAPVEAACDGTLVTAPSLQHGPSAFVPGPVRPKTQYAPHGNIAMEPLKLDVPTAPCACACAYPYSMAALILTPQNAVHVRNMLEAAGVVRVSKRLKRLSPVPCPCAAMGGQDMYNGLLLFAQQYEDTAVVSVPDPVRELQHLDELYVNEVLGNIRAQVVSGARANYLRAEGPRAYLQDRPVPEDEVPPPEECLPECLPGTGARTTPEDSKYATYTLTNPWASAKNRAALSCQTGLHIGGAPRAIDPVQKADAVERACPAAHAQPQPCSDAKPFVL